MSPLTRHTQGAPPRAAAHLTAPLSALYHPSMGDFAVTSPPARAPTSDNGLCVAYALHGISLALPLGGRSISDIKGQFVHIKSELVSNNSGASTVLLRFTSGEQI